MVLTVLTPGAAEIRRLEIPPGTKRRSFTIGSEAGWIIEGPGVRSVHALVQFDGVQLSMSSVDRASPVIVEGRVLPTTPTRIERSCYVMVGSIDLYLDLAAERDRIPTVPSALRRASRSRWPWLVAGSVVVASVSMAIRLAI